MNKIKIGSVAACVCVMMVCFIFYSGYVSQAVYDVRTGCLRVEGCSARKADAWPEGYTVSYYGDYEELADMEVVEVTWQLANITNEPATMDSYVASYNSMDGKLLYDMEEDTEDSALPGYENQKIIPAGEQAVYTVYVLVPEGSHEMIIKPGYMIVQESGDKEYLSVTF